MLMRCVPSSAICSSSMKCASSPASAKSTCAVKNVALATRSACPRALSTASVAASVVPFLVGVPYMALILGTVLGQQVTAASVLAAGVVPFILPGLIKAAAAAVLVPLAWVGVRAVDRRRDA